MPNKAQLLVVYDGPDAKAGDDLYKKLKREAEKAMPGNIAVLHNNEERFKRLGTVVKVYPSGQLYAAITPADTEQLVQSLQQGQVLSPFVYAGDSAVAAASKNDSLFSILLENMNFTKTRICGKCCPCRLGGPRIAWFLKKFDEGKANQDDLTMFYQVAFSMQKASMCAVGMFGADPVLFSLKAFKEQFEAVTKEAQ